MMIEKFSLEVRKHLEEACRLAVKKSHKNVTLWHLLNGLIGSKDKYLKEVFEKNNVDLSAMALGIESKLLALPKATTDNQDTPISRNLEKVLIVADEIGSGVDEKYIKMPHLLKAMFDDTDVAQFLTKSGLKSNNLEGATVGLKKTPTGKADNEFLRQYTTDVTEQARGRDMDPIIGRDEEIRKIIQVLCRRTKNNPLLIGEPGVGKTAVVEALAQAIVAGLVPESLLKTVVLSVDMGQMVAGTKMRGEFEERLTRLIDEAKKDPNIILFIDEVHLIVGAGKTDGAMDASNLIKPAMARGEIRCMGATTLEEYRLHIEKDSALTRRFQTVMVDEPTEEEALSILRGLKAKYEGHHGVRILDASLQAAVRLSKRYITERFLPDKAIDLIDEAASAVRLKLASKPEELMALDKELIQVEIEINALEGESIPASEERLKELITIREDLQKDIDDQMAVWEKSRGAAKKLQNLRINLEEANAEMEEHIRNEDFSKVAELQYKVIPKLEEELQEYEGMDLDVEEEESNEMVTEDHIANTIAEWTGIPVAKMQDDELEKLKNLEEHFRNRVIGQENALTSVAKAVRRARAGLQDPNRPIASFLMMGPTGVGKTELAKSLAENVFNDESAMVRLDMSEFMEKSTIAKLIGAAPGYVGYEEGGLLTNKIRRKPFSVVLFDEVEKAHKDIFNLLLQVLDDGRLSDSSGNLVDFSNTIILLTSNLGAKHIDDSIPDDIRASDNPVMQSVKDYFPPEFINRLDDLILFRKLTHESMLPILQIQLNRVTKLLELQDIKLTVEDDVKSHLADLGYSPEYGARPLKRVLQTELQDLLADAVIAGEVKAGQEVVVTLTNDAISLNVKDCDSE